MVERHSVEFTDKDEAQKLEFFEGDVHLGHYDFRFDFNDKNFQTIRNFIFERKKGKELREFPFNQEGT